jgi:hypothetical protein
MSIKERRRLRVAIVTLAVVTTGVIGSERVFAQTVPLTFNANVQLTKLHPDVTQVGMECRAVTAGSLQPIPISRGIATPVPVVNRGYAGAMTATMNVNIEYLANVDYTLTVVCDLLVTTAAGSKPFLATAARPTAVTTANYDLVAAGSTVRFIQTVTFPNVNVAP